MKLALINGVNDIESNVFWLISDIKVPCSKVVHGDTTDNGDLEHIGVEDELTKGLAGLGAVLFRLEVFDRDFL